MAPEPSRTAWYSLVPGGAVPPLIAPEIEVQLSADQPVLGAEVATANWLTIALRSTHALPPSSLDPEAIQSNVFSYMCKYTLPNAPDTALTVRGTVTQPKPTSPFTDTASKKGQPKTATAATSPTAATPAPPTVTAPVAAPQPQVQAQPAAQAQAQQPQTGLQSSQQLSSPTPVGAAVAQAGPGAVAGATGVPSTPPSSSPDEEFWRIYEEQKSFVSWNYTYKLYVSADMAESWKNFIKERGPSALAFKIEREVSSEYTEVTPAVHRHTQGRCMVDLTPLLQMGENCVQGRFSVVKDDQEERPDSHQSGSLQRSGGEEELHPPPTADENGGGSRSTTPVGRQRPKKSGGRSAGTDSKSADKGAKGAGRGRGTSAPRGNKNKRMKALVDRLFQLDHAESPFETAKTYCIIEISFAKPLVPKPVTPKLHLTPADFIPKRPPLPQYHQLREATQEFSQEISDIIAELAQEYKTLFEVPSAEQQLTKDQRRKQFLYALNTGGQYFTFKEKLKKAVVRIVNEKFHKQRFDSKRELDLFLNELYVFLMDEMHTTLNKTMQGKPAGNDTPPPKDAVAALARLQRLAEDAELVGNNVKAAAYHKEQLVINKWDPVLWYDYGLFCIRANDFARAEECMLEALSIDSQHVPSLLVSAVLSIESQFKKGEQIGKKGEVFLEAAFELEPSNVVALGLLALVHNLSGRDEEGESALARAATLNQNTKKGVLSQAAHFLLSVRATHLAEKVVAQEVLEKGPCFATSHALAVAYMHRGEYSRAEAYAKEALQYDLKRQKSLLLLGHIFWYLHNTDEAIAFFEKAFDNFQGSLTDLRGLMRLGDLYMACKKYEEAKTAFFCACKVRQSCYTWFRVGVACYRLGNFQEAEDALAEANIQNNHEPEVWGYLALLCLRLRRDAEADQSLRQALKLQLANADLLGELGDAYMDTGNLQVAEMCLHAALRACGPPGAAAAAPVDARYSAPRLQRLLGDCLSREDKHADAIAQYEQVVASTAGGDYDHTQALERLKQLHGKSGDLAMAQFYEEKQQERYNNVKDGDEGNAT
eukprot:TRINITY_DN79_c0_g2_i1.p1 TRINITY_DN79_c0_g2~~TRINITY_DN79_c0_g2_i1.p1  ORF type:complete len:1197 (+),score=355.13 TRINITY_DN79_c0_g2_i1:447-3593(+)